MADQSDIAATFRLLVGACPNFRPDEDTARAWLAVVGSVPGDILLAAATQVLDTRTSDWAPGPGQVKAVAVGMIRAREGRAAAAPMARQNLAQMHQVQALKANVAAAIGTDFKARDAGAAGDVYAQIQRKARTLPTPRHLPDWDPESAIREEAGRRNLGWTRR